tara:strand:+ start:6168 stop:6524 length:357 start_codon:yes stop_codon:yes gene_type:complete
MWHTSRTFVARLGLALLAVSLLLTSAVATSEIDCPEVVDGQAAQSQNAVQPDDGTMPPGPPDPAHHCCHGHVIAGATAPAAIHGTTILRRHGRPASTRVDSIVFGPPIRPPKRTSSLR